jgi:hypothetical protein
MYKAEGNQDSHPLELNAYCFNLLTAPYGSLPAYGTEMTEPYKIRFKYSLF